MIRRATALVVGGLALAVAARALVVEPRRLVVTRHRFGAGDGPVLRLVHLSDLHLVPGEERWHARVARAVVELAPDVVALTGDTLDGRGSVEAAARFLDRLPPAAFKAAVPGNGERGGGVDVDRLAAALARRNGRLLVNETVVLEHGGRPVAITGLDDWSRGRSDPRRAAREAPGVADRLLLAHCPIQRDLLPDVPAPDLMLAGHTHGGQIAPFGRAPVRPWGSGRYVAGWYAGDGPPMYVSRGVGTTAVPARLGARPEVALVEWKLSPRADGGAAR